MVNFKEISLKECEKEFIMIQRKIENLMYKLGDDCENIRIESGDLEQEFLKNQYRLILDKMIDIRQKIKYLSRPIKDKGILKKNKHGRYALPSGEYFTSGDQIEILYTDECDNEQYWILTRIEHNGEDYYAVALGKDKNINGMYARVR